MKTFPLEVCAHCTDGTNPFSCSFPSLTSTATRKPSRRWRVPPPAAQPLAAVRFLPPPQPSLSRHKPLTPTPVSATAPGGGRARWVAFVKPEICQGSDSSGLQTPTATIITHSSSPSFLLLLLSPSHPTVCIPLLALSPWLFSILCSLGCFCRRNEERGRVIRMAPSHSCTSPSFLPAWHKSYRAIRGQRGM